MKLRTLKVSFSLLLLAALSSVNAATPLYRGLDHHLDVMGLRALFPASKHEFWTTSGKIVSFPGFNAAEKSEFESGIKTGKGKYLVRLSQDESFSDVNYIEMELEAGRAKTLRLSFEKPVQYLKTPTKSWEESHRMRHPLCSGHKKNLTRIYGNPIVRAPEVEERLYHRPFEWNAKGTKVVLNCYQLDGKGDQLAESVIFRKR